MTTTYYGLLKTTHFICLFVTGAQICLALATVCFMLASAKPSYKFGYEVNDPNTRDLKEQQEYKDDYNQLHGYYRTLDSDGLMRTVTYKSHPSTGFEARVERVPYISESIPAMMSSAVSSMHRTDSAVAPGPIIVQPQMPDFNRYNDGRQSASQIEGANAGPYLETKTFSSVVHPSASDVLRGPLQSQPVYDQSPAVITTQ